MKYIFPKNFLWGASTAAHQVEGGNINNLSEWEHKNADYLAKTAKERLSWNKYTKEIPEIISNPENYISGKAIDHYNLYKSDFQLLKKLNLNAFRFSIEWSRIEPERGKFNQREVEHYREYIKELKKIGVDPFVTLWHWTVPLWVEKEGGIYSRNFSNYFLKFVEKVVSEYKDDVKYWITFNEPQALLYGIQNRCWMFKFGIKPLIAYLRIPFMHNRIYKAIKKIDSNAWVGLANHSLGYVSKTKSTIDILTVKIINWWQNRLIFDLTNKHSDFLGVNNYFIARIHNFRFVNEGKIFSDFGIELFPDSLYLALIDTKKYKKPVYITEHGLPDSKDKLREWYITESLKGVHKAIEEGIDVKGYMHWSLLDNFEWDSGFWPEFGLVEVNRDTMERKIRKSAYKYATLAKENGFYK
ncbi:family 1 glycosylhydrolase [Candidatus Dojkabacteria bacterium]|nr:family 1 glycosylhydrolase [Candidatus Dojkabacteria bacterium]